MQILHPISLAFTMSEVFGLPRATPSVVHLTISIPTIRERGVHVTDVTWLNHGKNKLTMGLLHQPQFNHNTCSKTAVIQIVEICPKKKW